MRTRWFRSAAAALLLFAGLLLACAPPSPPGAATAPSLATAPPSGDERDREVRALLLHLADRKLFEPFTVDRCLEGDGALRRELALTLGRIGDPRGRPVLEELLIDVDADVRRAAAFGLGLLGLPASLPALRRAAVEPDEALGARAVEAAIRCGADLEWVLAGLAELPPEDLFRRLLPSLHRLASEEIAAVAPSALSDAPSEQLAWVALALEHRPSRGGLAVARELVAGQDTTAIAAAARSLGAVGEATDREVLSHLVEVAEPAVVAAALSASSELFARGAAAPAADWGERLLRLVDDPRPGVRLAAIRAAAAVSAEEAVVQALVGLLENGAEGERAAALLALSAGGRPAAFDALARASSSPSALVRRAAAAAAGRLRADQILDRLAGDDAPAVRWAAFEAQLARSPETAAQVLTSALADSDPLLRAHAAEVLAAQPVLPVEELQTAFVRAQTDERDVVRFRLVEALAARAKAAPLERGAVLLSLDELSRHSHYLVRRAAAAELGRLGEPEPAVGAVESRLENRAYRGVVEQTRAARRLEMETTRGTVAVELDCSSAPISCLAFLQLAVQGYYDGLAIFRVEPGRILLAGDPNGDGWGGPGFELRDEPTLRPVRRGTLGLDRPRPDTSGSVFFIALGDLPWRDGEGAAFGSIVGGLEHLERAVPGDRILRMREVVGGVSAVR